MPHTTALVGESPTACAPLPVCRPRRQPIARDQREHERLDEAPTTSVGVTAFDCFRKVTGGKPNDCTQRAAGEAEASRTA